MVKKEYFTLCRCGKGQALKIVVLKEALNAAVLYAQVETLSPISIADYANEAL